MKRDTLIALAAGVVFGAGLAVSGMTDPARVRGFLDMAGRWDPTLAFVMAGAVLAMAIAWRVAAWRRTPFAAASFPLPVTLPIDTRLIAGSALFGIGWGLVGLCPGPALASIVLHPLPALLFVIAMSVGALAHHLAFIRPLTTQP